MEETFRLRRRRKHAIVNAVIKPEYWAQVRARIGAGTDEIEVQVDRISECGRDSVVMVSGFV